MLDQFDAFSREESKLLGLTASPERRTGDQKDQLGLAFDAIIDCADIEELIKEKVLVPAEYKSFFIHDLELEKMDISTGDFPVEQLSNAIITSSSHILEPLIKSSSSTIPTQKPAKSYLFLE